MRRVRWLLVLVLVAAACGESGVVDVGGVPPEVSSTATTDPPAQVVTAADGVLDCLDGQVVRSADIRVPGGSEQEVVDLALAEWVDRGGVVVVPSSDETWSVVDDGREVAVAVPEIEGDGGWVVHDVVTCGEPKTEPAPIDGELDCASDVSWGYQATIPRDAPGADSADDAIREDLARWVDRFGGEIVIVGEGVGSLVVGGREQVVVRASEFPLGWVVESVFGCDGYRDP